jgi:WD40 repeat protein
MGLKVYVGGRFVTCCAAALFLVACSTNLPQQPANLIIQDAHNVGKHVSVGPRSRYLASAGGGGWVSVWRLPGATPVSNWEAHQGSVTGLWLVPGERLLTAGTDGRVVEWSLQGEQVRELRPESSVVTFTVNADRDRLLSGHADGSVSLWRLSDLRQLAHHALYAEPVSAVALQKAGNAMAAGGSDNRVYYWREGEKPAGLPTSPRPVRTLAFSENGARLYGAAWFDLYDWDIAARTLATRRTEHQGAIPSIRVMPNGSGVVSISRETDSSVLLLDPETGQTLKRLQAHELCGSDVAVSPDGRFVATTSDDASVRVWDMQNPLPDRVYFNERSPYSR